MNGAEVQQDRGRKRGRERWGPPMSSGTEQNVAEASNGQPRKRKSRWESAESNTNRALITIPREVTLPGGIKVRFLTILTSALQSLAVMASVQITDY